MKNIFHGMDWNLAFYVSALSLIGVLAVFSATHQSPELAWFWKRQFFWMLFSVLVMLTVSRIDYHIWLELGNWIYWISILSLIVVVFFSAPTKGASRWIKFGGVSFQPSELAKYAILLVLARQLASRSVELLYARRLALILALVGLPLLLILNQPDLGSAILLVPVCILMMFVGGIPLRRLSWIFILGAASSPIVWHFLRDYQRKRLLVFMDPQADPLGAGYNIIQSIIAIGSGGIAGKGFTHGTQTQLSFIPEHHTDFIFSVIGEEFGFMGSLVVIGLYLLLFREGYAIARKARDPEGMLLAFGIVSLFSAQVIVNISMSIGLMPVTGLTLPFISYGGSSLLVSLFAIGILLNISYAIRRPVLLASRRS